MDDESYGFTWMCFVIVISVEFFTGHCTLRIPNHSFVLLAPCFTLAKIDG